MRPLPQPLFDVYALALPRGHGFGVRLPIEAFASDDNLSCAVVMRDEESGKFGCLVMRRREDHVWSVTLQENDLATANDAHMLVEQGLAEGVPPEQVPPGIPRRPALYDLQGREPSDIFKLLVEPTHHVAAWLINQLYLSLPNPDRSWAGEFQTENSHTRLWEALLLASFREQGLLVTQPQPSPDFSIENRRGGQAWVEAVTANPAVRYSHVGAPPSEPPTNTQELFFGQAALRFAKTLGNKLSLRYDLKPHVIGKPFAIALADFHAPSSMVWSRQALSSYLYGTYPETIEVQGKRVAVPKFVDRLLGGTGFPAGLFHNKQHSELSAVIFSNACTLGKFNRVGVSAGMEARGLRYVRFGKLFDRTPGALDGTPFCLDVTSPQYRALWPQHYEPWSAELEVYHNPFADNPIVRELLPEAQHWFVRDGEVSCAAHYKTSVLWSRTLIQSASAPMPKFTDFYAANSEVGAQVDGALDVDQPTINDE